MEEEKERKRHYIRGMRAATKRGRRGKKHKSKSAKHTRQEWGHNQQHGTSKKSKEAHSSRVATKISPLEVESSQGGVIGGGPLRVLSCKEGLGEGKQNE